MRRSPARPSTRHPLAALLLAAALSLSAATAHAAWPTTPSPNVPVMTDTTNRFAQNVLSVPDSCGGAIISWVTNTPSPAIQAQRLDRIGQPRWITDGVNVTPAAIPGITAYDIASDAAGGAFVVWSQGPYGDGDIFAQHLLSSGAVDPAWPPAGVPVCVLPADQAWPVIAPDGSGGAVMAWQDSRGNVDHAPDIYAQRVSATGAILWAPNGVPVVDAIGQQYSPSIVGDGAGGLYAAWEDHRSDTGDIYAQHLDPVTGARTWVLSGLAIGVAPNTQYVPRVVFDVGRLFVVWPDARVAGSYAIYAQAVSPTGVVAWAVNGVPVNGPLDPNNGTPCPVSDGLGGVIVGWEAFDSGGAVDDIHAQRLDPVGNPAWGPSGVVVCAAPGRQLFMRGITDQRGGAIFGWDDRRLSEGDIDIYARRVDASGAVLWTPDGVVVSNRGGVQVGPTLVTDGAGGGILAWQDYRSGLEVSCFAQQIGGGGQLGVRLPSNGCQPDLCGFAYTDFGDAPESGVAFPSGAPGHYPTCITDTAPGTQTIACGAALSPPPGPTGYVEHVATWSDAVYFGLGCGPASTPHLAVDSELDGIVGASGAPGVLVGSASACSPAATIPGEEAAFGGLWFAVDEKPGDGDAGLDQAPVFVSCGTSELRFKSWLCAPSAVTVRLNVLVDWNQDGDWNDVVACGAGGVGACAPEWAIKNASIVLQPGCNTLVTPAFVAGPATGPSWMRITLTADPVPDDFPWAGSAHVPGPLPGVPGGTFAGGETEDYPVTIVTSTGVGNSVTAFEGLAPVTPNPGRDESRIRFGLPREAPVHLAVYDLAGRRVRVLADGVRGAGQHELRWDGRGEDGVAVRPGIYFVRLATGGRLQTRSVVRLQ